MLKNIAYFLFEETLWLCGLMPTTRRRITNDYPSKHGAS